MLNINKILFKIIPILYLISIVTILTTAYISGYEHLLQQMSHEDSFFESVGTLWFFMIFLYGIYALYHYEFKGYKKLFVIIFTILGFWAGMEEISWGQQLFHFPSSDYFIEHNLQQETNLHNLVNANLFSSIIYSSVYTFLVFIPLFYKIFPYLHKFKLLRYFDINPHTILVVLFASVFQLYFYNNICVWFDMVTHFFALTVFGFYLFKSKSTIWLKLHFTTIVIATAISISCYHIYSFLNMQYEIRESFAELAGLLIFVELIEQLKIVKLR
ncbi:MAG TPA: hypothetical protein ENK99_06175 [Campylobacterales bacterium]|nr:hypothetical protein [Campylobacterales bacterium]